MSSSPPLTRAMLPVSATVKRGPCGFGYEVTIKDMPATLKLFQDNGTYEVTYGRQPGQTTLLAGPKSWTIEEGVLTALQLVPLATDATSNSLFQSPTLSRLSPAFSAMIRACGDRWQDVGDATDFWTHSITIQPMEAHWAVGIANPIWRQGVLKSVEDQLADLSAALKSLSDSGKALVITLNIKSWAQLEEVSVPQVGQAAQEQ